MGIFSEPTRGSSGSSYGLGFSSPQKKKKKKKRLPPVATPGLFERLLSGAGSALEIIDRPRRTIQEGMAEIGGMGTPDVSALDILLHGKTGKTGRDIVDKIGGGKLDPKKTPWYNPGNLARAAGGFGLDVLMDPLSYVGVGFAPKLAKGGKLAVKAGMEGIEGLSEVAARKAVNASIEGGARGLGQKSGIRLLGKTVIPGKKIAAASEKIGLSKLGRGIRKSDIGQAYGKRMIPGFRPREIDNLPGGEYGQLWDEANEYLQHMGRQKELRTQRVVDSVRKSSEQFSNEELKMVLRVVENPKLGKRLRESGELTDDLVDYIRRSKKQMKAAARVEQGAGLLGGKLRKDYVKHLGLEEASGGRKLSSGLAREYTGTVEEINEAAGKDIFENMFSIAHGTRLAESTRKLTNAEAVDEVLKRYGQQITPGMVMPEGFEVYKRQGQNLVEVPRSMVAAPHEYGTTRKAKGALSTTKLPTNNLLDTVDAANATPKQNLASVLGVEDVPQNLLGFEDVSKSDLVGTPWARRSTEEPVVNQIFGDLGQKAKADMTPDELRVFEKELAKYRLMPKEFANLAKTFTDKEAGDALTSGWKKGHALWKSYVYGIRPGAQGRNALWNSTVSGIAGMKNPKRLKQSADIMSGKAGVIKTSLGETLEHTDIRKWAQELGVEGHGFYGADVPEKVMDVLGRGRKTTLNPASLNNPALRAGRRFGTGVENNARMALFVDQLIKGETKEQAARVVNKYLFDYANLTPFEQKYMKQLMPFYTFTRKNIPLQFKTAVEKPGVYAALPKGKAAVESLSEDTDETNLPSYLKRNMSIRTPFKQGDNPLYWLANLGFEDLKKPMQPNDLFSMLSPAIKIPVEQMTNRNIYFDSPIEKTPGRPVGVPAAYSKLPKELKDLLGVTTGKDGYYEGKDVMSAWTRYYLDQVPQSRDLTRIAAGDEKSALSLLALLTGARMTPFDEKLAEQFATGNFPRKKKRKALATAGDGQGIF